ncbi:MAG TPA: SDR family oxidoreductase [Candidatus Limiplasma sp.]|nr:SDR family oxidoreductase [Candidatus Limiplasma sp.]
MRLNGKNALITGASRGIGKATAELFAQQGANIWAFANRKSDAFEAWCANTAAQYGVFVKPIYADLTDADAVKAAVKQAMADKLPLDILVNNAGVMGEDKMFQMTRPEEMQRTFAVNFFGTMALTQIATRWMARKQRGAVVNVASVAGLDGDSRLDYSASKAALIAATKKMARELIASGIRVNAVAPGFTDTEMTSCLSDKVVADAMANNLMHRKGTPREIAAVIAFLASDDASFVTAQIWRADGGII